MARPDHALGAKLGEPVVRMLHLASLAPSSCNVQPWRIQVVSPNQWILGSAPNRWLRARDPQNMETLLGIGAFLENLVQAAMGLGFRVQYETLTNDPRAEQLLAVELKLAQILPIGLERLQQRRTLRRGHKDREIRGEDLRSLTDGADFVHYIPRGTGAARYLREATVDATRKRVFRDRVQQELAQWIRWRNEDAREHRTGLTPASMELTGVSAWYARHFYDRETVMSNNFRAHQVDRAAQLAAQGGGWLAITAADDSMSELIATGRRFQNLFLRARDQRIAIHPMCEAVGESPWREQVARELNLGGAVPLLLRIGYREPYPEPVSLRMPVARFVHFTPT